MWGQFKVSQKEFSLIKALALPIIFSRTLHNEEMTVPKVDANSKTQGRVTPGSPGSHCPVPSTSAELAQSSSDSVLCNIGQPQLCSFAIR